jgi:hypothetical protein
MKSRSAPDRFPQQVEKLWNERATLVTYILAESQLDASDLQALYYAAFFDALTFVWAEVNRTDEQAGNTFAAKMNAAVEECRSFLIDDLEDQGNSDRG